MSTKSVILASFILSIFTIWIYSYAIEDGDVNAMSMYFVVFLIPCLVVIGLNGLIIAFANYKIVKIRNKRLIGMSPIVICGLILLGSEIQNPYFDGSLSFVGLVGLVSLGIPNLIWILKLKNN